MCTKKDSELEMAIQNVLSIDNKEEQKIVMLNILDDLESSNMESFRKYHIKGYLWYMMPEDSVERNNNIIHNINAAIQENPKYLFSNAYLAYFYFDKKDFQKVIEILENLDFSYFKKRDQLWQSLKLQELLVVSKLNMSKSLDRTLSRKLLKIVRLYTKLPENEIATPNELVNSIIDNINKEGVSNVLPKLISMVDSQNHKAYFEDEVRIKLKSYLR